MNPNPSFPMLAVVVTGLLYGCARSDPVPPAPATAASTATDSDPHALGAKPMTAEELARLEKLAPRVTNIEPNELARERLNAERKAQGLPPLPAGPAKPAPASAPK